MGALNLLWLLVGESVVCFLHSWPKIVLTPEQCLTRIFWKKILEAHQYA
ncbi:hypothetical protein BDE02_16G036200 [Populus trichocarpa]|nr:hypothetical protein BDE02_16G036200 [Populus trichocarpa]